MSGDLMTADELEPLKKAQAAVSAGTALRARLKDGMKDITAGTVRCARIITSSLWQQG